MNPMTDAYAGMDLRRLAAEAMRERDGLREALLAAGIERTMLRDERDLLRVQLQAFQGMPFVPKADFERLQGRYGEALANLDGLTATMNETPADAMTDRLVVCLAQLVRQIERVGGFSTDRDQAELREARSVIAECR